MWLKTFLYNCLSLACSLYPKLILCQIEKGWRKGCNTRHHQETCKGISMRPSSSVTKDVLLLLACMLVKTQAGRRAHTDTHREPNTYVVICLAWNVWVSKIVHFFMKLFQNCVLLYCSSFCCMFAETSTHTHTSLPLPSSQLRSVEPLF